MIYMCKKSKEKRLIFFAGPFMLSFYSEADFQIFKSVMLLSKTNGIIIFIEDLKLQDTTAKLDEYLSYIYVVLVLVKFIKDHDSSEI